LRWLERNGGFFAALRAGGLGLRPYGASASSSPSRFCSFRLARFAAFRLVLKSLVGEKHLFAGSEDKLGAALGTLQYLIVEFHGRLPLDPFRAVGTGSSFTMGWTEAQHACGDTAHASSGRRAKNLNKFPTSLPDWGLIPEVRRRAASLTDLVLLATLLLAQSLPRKRFLCPTLLAGLHVEAMLLDFLNDVFLLHLALESTQCILKRLILLNDYLCQ
jgi:hypothetical protein